MTDIRIACDCAAWGREGFTQCVDDLNGLCFWGVEATGEAVKQYYDKAYSFRQLLTTRGLRLAAVSDRIDPSAEDLEKEAGLGKMMCEFLCINGGGALVLDAGPRKPEGPSPDDFKRIAELCNSIGEFSKRLRVKTCIIQRAGTFAEFRAEAERILELTDPALVFFCPDTGLLAKQGENPVEAIRAHVNRIAHVHLRDFAPSAPDAAPDAPPQFTDLGGGCVNVAAIMEVLNGAHYKGVLTIIPDKTRPRESAAAGKAYFENKLGISIHPRPIPVIAETPPRLAAPEPVKGAAPAPAQPQAAQPAEQAAPPVQPPAQEAAPTQPPVQEPAPLQQAPAAQAPTETIQPAPTFHTPSTDERSGPEEIPAPEIPPAPSPVEQPPVPPSPAEQVEPAPTSHIPATEERPVPPEPEKPVPPASITEAAPASDSEEAPKPAEHENDEKPEERPFGYGILPDEDE